jgi:hypothetical protein
VIDESTEILIRAGWRKCGDIAVGTEVMTFNVKAERGEWQPVRSIKTSSRPSMVQVKSKKLNFCIDDEHSVIHKRSAYDEVDYRTEQSTRPRKYDLPRGVYPKDRKYSAQIRIDNKLHSLGTFDTPEEASAAYMKEARKLPERNVDQWIDEPVSRVFSLSQTTVPVSCSLGLPEYPLSDAMIALVGWAAAEGNFRKNGAIQLYQGWSKQKRITDLLDREGIKYGIMRRQMEGRELRDPRTGKIYYTKEDETAIHIPIKEARVLGDLIGEKELQSNRSIPNWVFDLSDRQFDIFLYAIVAGDGHWLMKHHFAQYYTSSRRLADMLQAMCVTHGWKAVVATKYLNQLVVGITKATKTAIFKYSWSRINKPSKVWYLAVSNNSIMTRRNDKAVILGTESWANEGRIAA